jgi:hypothetical protein
MIVMLIFIILWLNCGLLAAKSMNDVYDAVPLEEMVLPLRLFVILIAPVLLLIFERHLFYSSRDDW